MNHMTVDGSDAPWNQEYLPEKEIEVTISVTLSKTMKVLVNDYRVEEDIDEDGRHLSYDFSECDLHKAVMEQVTLPHELAGYTESIIKVPVQLEASIEDCKNWNVDDIECIMDN